MRLDEAVRNLIEVQENIDGFDHKCNEEEHTDTGEAWDLLFAARHAIQDLKYSWDNS